MQNQKEKVLLPAIICINAVFGVQCFLNPYFREKAKIRKSKCLQNSYIPFNLNKKKKKKNNNNNNNINNNNVHRRI